MNGKGGVREDAEAIVRAGLEAVNGYRAVAGALVLDGERLWVGNQCFDLRGVGRIVVVGCGKATWSMAKAVEAVLSERVAAGVISVKHGHAGDEPLRRIEVVEAGHPLPDAGSLEGAERAMALLDDCGESDLVIGLLSGGGSALWELPVDGVGLADLEARTRALLASGADITTINAERRRLSRIKGGGAARRADPARCVVLLIADVIGDDPATIASGPFWRDDGAVPHIVCADNGRARAAAAGAARARGYRVEVVEKPLAGPVADEVAAWWHAIERVERGGGPICLIAGGEPTVVLPAAPGEGGRSQHAALLLALEARGRDDCTLVCVGTDGTDGPTEAAGGVVDGGSIEHMVAAGVDPEAAAARFDAGPALAAAGDRLITGPTDTNVMDIWIALLDDPGPRHPTAHHGRDPHADDHR